MSHTSSHWWNTESYGEVVTLKQLTFSSWKASSSGLPHVWIESATAASTSIKAVFQTRSIVFCCYIFAPVLLCIFVQCSVLNCTLLCCVVEFVFVLLRPTLASTLFIICGNFNCHHANWLGVGTSLTSHCTWEKDFCDSMGPIQSVNFSTRISPNGKSSFLDLVMTNIPANVSSSSSAPIGSSDYMLVKVNIPLAILREPPQRHRFWYFI